MIPKPSDEYMARLKGKPQYEYEHGSGFAIPVEVTSDPDLIDMSWHNNVCPSFACEADDPDEPCQLWIDRPNPDERENDGAERFTVTDGAYECLYAGDDIHEALAVLKDAVKRRQGNG
jgi:hypothetical protein